MIKKGKDSGFLLEVGWKIDKGSDDFNNPRAIHRINSKFFSNILYGHKSKILEFKATDMLGKV